MTYTFCPRCKGSGYYTTELVDQDSEEPCYICRGKGHCNPCQGSGKCTHCGCGRCDRCYGTGKCHHCHGSKTVIVKRKVKVYHRCYGDTDGAVLCTVCNGKGTVPQEVADRGAGNAR